MQSIAANLEGWTREVKRETAVYHTLNKLSMDVTRKVLVAEAWVPTNAKARVQEALQSAAQRSSASVSLSPPSWLPAWECIMTDVASPMVAMPGSTSYLTTSLREGSLNLAMCKSDLRLMLLDQTNMLTCEGS